MLNVEKNGEIVAQLKAHENSSVTQLLVNQENNMMYTAGGDGLIKTW